MGDVRDGARAEGRLRIREGVERRPWGNLVYRKTARNFNPMMATAAKVTIAEVEHLVEVGELDRRCDAYASDLCEDGFFRVSCLRRGLKEDGKEAG